MIPIDKRGYEGLLEGHDILYRAETGAMTGMMNARFGYFHYIAMWRDGLFF